jgi:hypothetical protein
MWFYDMRFYGGFLVRAFGLAPRRQHNTDSTESLPSIGFEEKSGDKE